MASSSILPTLISWQWDDVGCLKWISRRAAPGFSISIFQKATVASSIYVSEKAAARTTNIFSCRGAQINVMSVSDESIHLPLKISPWLLLPPAFKGGDVVYNIYSLAENKILSFNKRGGGEEEESELPEDDAELVGSSHGWLAFFSKRNGDLFLTNPLSCRHMKLLPIHTLPITQVDYRSGLCRWVLKVNISCSPDEEECRAMMIYSQTDRLAFCLPGCSMGVNSYWRYVSHVRARWCKVWKGL